MSRQGDLFVAKPEVLVPAPSLEPEALTREARRRLKLALAELGEAEVVSPSLSAARGIMMARVHHTMASWLPEQERGEIRAQLRSHWARLGVTAREGL
jgi:hypothetical protein